MFHRKEPYKFRTKDFAKYFVDYTDYRGRQSEQFILASDAMMRAEALSHYPGIRDISWRTARGYVFAHYNRSQGVLL